MRRGVNLWSDEENQNVSDYDAALARCGMLDEEALARPWPFRGRQMDVRYALYRTLEDAQEVHVRVSAADHPESRRILALAQEAFGSLRALLVGVPETLLDKSPRAGEWSIREIILHMVAVEQRYALQTKYAIDRTDADPIQCEKTLLALGWRPAEGRRIARRVASAIGEIEGLDAVKDARELEARLVERVASVAS